MKTIDRVYLREWRLAKGLTQPELAKRVGTVKSEISRLEKGSRRMTLDWMSSFAKAMGITVEDLMSLPPMGFGAVSPAPPSPARDIVYEVANLGDVSIAVQRGSHLFTMVNGDDWVGMFAPGDLLIYDTSKKSTAVPGIFAMQVDGEVMTRRIMPSPDGPVLTCANPAYPAMPLGDEQVLGRVVARVHRV